MVKTVVTTVQSKSLHILKWIFYKKQYQRLNIILKLNVMTIYSKNLNSVRSGRIQIILKLTNWDVLYYQMTVVKTMYRVIKVPGDGNCLYNCASILLSGNANWKYCFRNPDYLLQVFWNVYLTWFTFHWAYYIRWCLHAKPYMQKPDLYRDTFLSQCGMSLKKNKNFMGQFSN